MLHETLGFQLQLDGYKHEVIIAANVSTMERPSVYFVDAGLELLTCQDEVYLIVNLLIRGMPCQVAVLDNLWRWRVLARVSW